MPVLLAFSLIAVAALLWAASFPSTESREAAPMLLLFLGLFPLLNAVWDFASLGLTRYCLRQSLVDAPLGPLPASFRPLVFNLIDLIGALLALGGLILSLLFAVSAMNHLAPEPILPLTRLILDLRPGAGGPDMTWAYLMVFSTLLPSLAHLLIFLISLVLRYPGRKLRRWMAQRPPADDAAKTAHADAAALMIALWVTLPVAVIALAFWYLLPGIPEFHENSLTWLLAQISWLVAVFELS